LAFVEVALATLQELLLADVGIPRAPCQQRRQQANRHYRTTKSRAFSHTHISHHLASRKLCRINALLHQGTLWAQSRKVTTGIIANLAIGQRQMRPILDAWDHVQVLS
jgi:hypothetical protein